MQLFGHSSDGAPIHLVTLDSGAGLRAEISNYGGILRRLSFPGRNGRTSLVLGLPTLDDYVRDPAYLGVLVGRYANRIAGATFNLSGRDWTLTANNGRNHLHGGAFGFGKRVWRILEFVSGPNPYLRLGYQSPAGEEGYPGSLDATAEFALSSNELTLHFEARCDAPTPLSLTYHPYFNLAGSPAIPAAKQTLTTHADQFLPISNAELIPIGEIASVAGTPLDFRSGRRLQISSHEHCDQTAYAGGYDHCLILRGKTPIAAELHSEDSGISMQIDTDLPALQLYDGHHLDQQHPALGRGICLEPQEYPNAPNLPALPAAILNSGDTWRRYIRYRFLTVG